MACIELSEKVIIFDGEVIIRKEREREQRGGRTANKSIFFSWRMLIETWEAHKNDDDAGRTI